MSAPEEHWHSFDDGTKAYCRTWKPEGQTKARLVFIHGFSDHCNAYYQFFPALASKGIQVHALDQRGWGQTCSSLPVTNRGLTGPSSRVYADITSFIRPILSSTTSPSVPVFLMGHSMGGAEVLCYASYGPSDLVSQIRGFLAESPLIALHPSADPPRIKTMLLRAVMRVAPNLQQVQKLDAKFVCRDESVQRDWVNDKLCHDTGTLEGLAGMLDRAEELKSGNLGLEGVKSVWIGHGTEDRITWCEASKGWIEACKVKDKQLKLYDGWYHKLHAEPGQDRYTFYDDVSAWILRRCGNQATISAEDVKPKL